MSATVIPLGSLAILFAGISILVLFKKAVNAKEVDKAIKSRIAEKRVQKTYH